MFRKQVNSSKWQGKIEGQNYPLTIADMDLALYSPFKEKLIQKMTDLNNLTYKNRSSQYFESIINWYNKHHKTNNFQNPLSSSANLKSEDFVQSPSICNLIGCSILAFTKQNQNVLIFTPVYSFYIYSIKSLNRSVVCCDFEEVPQRDNQTGQIYNYKFNQRDFEQKMAQYKPKLIILCNPHNPSGKVFTDQELNIIVKKAQQCDTYILSDEIMGDFTLYNSQKKQNQKITYPIKKITSLVNYSYPKIIVGNSISKVFNCESVQGGYGIIRSSQTRNLFNKIGLKAIKLLTNQMSLMLTPIIYSIKGQEWIIKVNTIFKENFNLFVYNFKGQKCLKIFNLESGYLTTIEFNFSPINSARISTNQNLSAILQKFGIFFVDMKEYIYPPTSRNLFRIAIAMETQEFKKFIIKFSSCINFMKDFFKEFQQNQTKAAQYLKNSKL